MNKTPGWYEYHHAKKFEGQWFLKTRKAWITSYSQIISRFLHEITKKIKKGSTNFDENIEKNCPDIYKYGEGF